MPYKIAVVDDDALTLKVAGHILSKNGMTITAFRSGKDLLDHITDSRMDLILLDILMPEMDGFETLGRLRQIEKDLGLDETPVIFLTAESETDVENKGFEVGVSDFIRKPFDSEILLRRVENVLSKQDQINRYQKEASTDQLTGCLNKASASERIAFEMGKRSGFLMMTDIDSFKLVNDIYGHDAGDQVLRAFADIVRQHIKETDILGRVGGDEFALYAPSFSSEEDIAAFTRSVNEELINNTKDILGSGMDIHLGVSVGAVYVAGTDTDLEARLAEADRALLSVKQNGKHGYSISGKAEDPEGRVNLKKLSMILSERNISNSALKLDLDSFIDVYRFVVRYLIRYHKDACKLLLSLSKSSNETDEEYDGLTSVFAEHVSDCLRKSDLLMQYSKDQFFVFLTDIKEDAVEQVVGNIIRQWRKKHGEKVIITYEVEFIKTDAARNGGADKPWVIIVDDDPMNLKIASRILGKNDMSVSTLSSGKELLEFVSDNRPDLILLDINMPEMDGFETIRLLRAKESEIADIPVVFLTSDTDGAAEKTGLSLGALDFITKPFVPEVLTLRIRQIIELIKLQKHLADEVAKKTRENEQLFLNVVSSLAGAIDAKDTYTNGHSGRVAEYSRKIARNYGYSSSEQSDIYIIAMLHDVGKIGVPDAVINKPGKLTDEEFEYIKKHPVTGYQILQKIGEMPQLSVGARWHHERYDGSGYPDGLSGEDIPEIARIIAVADAYDAMTSNRSYRKIMPQDKVRQEIENGKGTQFDPKIADVMIRMIDEDTGYTMREL